MTVAADYQEETGLSSATSINIPIPWDYDNNVANIFIVQQDLTNGDLNNSGDGSFTFAKNEDGDILTINQSSFFTGNSTSYTVSRVMPQTQDYDLTETAQLDAPSLETGLDDPVRMLQDLLEEVLKHSITSQETFVIDTKLKRADKFLAFDSSGNVALITNAPGIGDMQSSIYDPADVAEQLVGLTAIQLLLNKTINGVVLNAAGLITKSLREDGTYQTVTSGGDMLVSVYDPAAIAEQLVGLAASQTLTNKSVNGVTLTAAGSSSNSLREDGSYVAVPSAGGDYTIQVFTAGGTWNKPAGLVSAKITVIAGGGGGGGVSGDGFGIGGAGGGAAIVVVDEASLGSSETVTIGALGAGGVTSSNGSAGGSSSFGAHASATGGSGGTSDTTATSTGTTGGAGTGGDINITGGSGNSGLFNSFTETSSMGGPGGDTMMGTGGEAVTTESAAIAGRTAAGYGGGGSGAVRDNSGSGTANGGAGTAGIIIVEEYY